MKKAMIGAALALPILWLAYNVYDLSIRHGTADPCEMIAERLTAETFEAIDPLGLNRLLNLQRPSNLAQTKARVREHGAWACWRSVLFDVPTRTEVIHAIISKADSITRMWMGGGDGARELALDLVEAAEVDVIEHLLRDDEGRATVRAALKEHPEGRLAKKIEAAVDQVCRFGSASRDACIRRHFGLIGYSPPLPTVRGTSSSIEPAPRRSLPMKSERARAVGRDYVAAGLATAFTVEAETLRLTTTLYPESLARRVCSNLPIGVQAVVYHPDREQPVAQCEGRIPWVRLLPE